MLETYGRVLTDSIRGDSFTIAIAHVSITVHSVHGRERPVFVNVLQLTMLVLLAYLI